MPYTYSAGSGTVNLGGMATYNGVTVNDGTFVCTHLAGIVDSAPVRVPMLSHPSHHGGILGTRFADPLTLAIEGYVDVGDYTQIGPALDQLRSAFNVDAGLQTLTVNYPGWAGARQLSAAVAGQIVVQEPEMLEKLVPQRNFSIPLVAPDPLLYDAVTLKTATIAMPSGSVSVTNNGTAAAPFTARFTGPFTGPVTLTCTTNSQQIVYSGNAIAGAYLDVNTNPITGITVVSNTGANYYYQLGTLTALTIPVGTSSWSVSGATGTTGASQVTLTWRDAWW